jgi:haloacetate dehalogenase
MAAWRAGPEAGCPQNAAMTAADLLPGFRHLDIPTAEGVHIHTVVGGEGPPLLLLHGHPQTHAIWHRGGSDAGARMHLGAPA